MRITPLFAGITGQRPAKVVCVGSLMVDNIATPKLEDMGAGEPDLNNLRGAKLAAKGPIRKELGGGAANVSISFKNLGFTPMPLGRIANDQNGRWLRNQLTKLGIDQGLVQEHHIPKPKSLAHRLLLQVEKLLRHLERLIESITGTDIPSFLLVSNEFDENETRCTGQSLVINFPTDRTVVTCRGVANELQLKDIDWDALSTAQGLYISNFGSQDSNFLQTLVEKAKTANPNILISFNPGKGHLKNGLEQNRAVLPNLDILNLNLEEAQELSGLGKEATIDQLLLRLKAAGPKVILITNGSKGAYAYDGKQCFFMPPYKVQVASTLGAGDAFGSTFFAYMLEEPGNLGKALQYGSANAACVVQSIGASRGLKNRADLETFVSQRKADQPDIQPVPYAIKAPPLSKIA